MERKVNGAEGFNKSGTLLTDEFLHKAFSRYLKLMHSLHKPDTSKAQDTVAPFDAAASSLKIMIWATE